MAKRSRTTDAAVKRVRILQAIAIRTCHLTALPLESYVRTYFTLLAFNEFPVRLN
jgi:hypothetical protein